MKASLPTKFRTFKAAACAMALTLLVACSGKPGPGEVQDEAKLAGRDAASFPHADEDYFHDMDGAPALTPDEIKGRNMWIVWSGGNDRFWNQMGDFTFGAFDLLKMISSHPSLGFSRDNRWSYLGLINEPCFEKAAGPDKDRRGLWLDVRSKDCAADPFENEKKYPGVVIGSRGKSLGDGTTQPVGSYYGYATGIVGLRLFPNPDFDEKAAKAWDAERYYTDPAYYNRKDLVRPYRVGMSCGFCHVGPSPVKPPDDPEHPKFANLSSSVGAQYMWVDRLFIVNSNKPEGRKNFMYQLAHTYRPGSMDTSLVSTDSINNPRTMNSVYDFVAAWAWPSAVAREARRRRARQQAVQRLHQGRTADRVLRQGNVDGEDAARAEGRRRFGRPARRAESRVPEHRPLQRGVAAALQPDRRRQDDHADPHRRRAEELVLLECDRGGHAEHGAVLPQGRAAGPPEGRAGWRARISTPTRRCSSTARTCSPNTCARCHSSKGPRPPESLDLKPENCAGADYLACFKRYWTWTQSDEFKTKMREVVHASDFLQGNYLSSDARIPVTLLRTNACSPLATNALGGNIWDNFSSQSYKQLPSVGRLTMYDPFDGSPFAYDMPAGGRGYTRVPSLIALWSSAPFLLANTVGPFDPDPSVASRMKSFDASIEQMLWPEKRAARCEVRRQGARHDRPHDRAQLGDDSGRLRARGASPAAGLGVTACCPG